MENKMRNKKLASVQFFVSLLDLFQTQHMQLRFWCRLD